MNQLTPDLFNQYVPATIALFCSIAVLWFLNWLLLSRHKSLGSQARIPRQLVMLSMTILALLTLVIVFPMSDSTRGQIITLLGLVITGVVALASTTFVANVMAGLMLSAVKSFMPGDFIRVGEQFGRVTERGLFHTEIQTQDRDLTTLPNLHLATNPVTVVHAKGTIITADLSLGYDVPRAKIEELLKKAAINVDLADPFVLVTALNDFSVSYRVCGFLAEIESLITSRSNLNKSVLDVLHVNDIEIVSPGFVYQRQMSDWENVIPEAEPVNSTQVNVSEPAPEELIFDKAKDAAETEDLREKIQQLQGELAELNQQKKSLSSEEKHLADEKIQQMKKQLDTLIDILKLREETKPA